MLVGVDRKIKLKNVKIKDGPVRDGEGPILTANDPNVSLHLDARHDPLHRVDKIKDQVRIETKKVGKNLHIRESHVDGSSRRQGLGVESYDQMYAHAQKRGGTLVSDSEVSSDAQRVWKSLEKRGYTIEKNTKVTKDREGALVAGDGNLRPSAKDDWVFRIKSGSKKKETGGVTPLPEDQFKTFEDFRDFVIEHELAHTDFRPNKGESIPQYEDRINQIALKRVGHRGKASAEFEQSKLAQSGIDANMAGRISAQFEQYGMREGRVMIAQTKKWKDRGAAQAYSAALGKDINTIIVTPGAGDLPSSMSGGLEKFDIAKGRKAKRVAKVESGEELNRWEKIEDTFMGPQVAQMLFQFKSFGVAATNRILVPGLQRPDKNFLIGAAGLVGLGVMVDHIRDGQLGSKRPKTSSQRLKAGIDRSGMLGWFGDANGALETLSDGRFGIGPMMGDHGYKRSKLSKLGAVAGPSVSQGKNIARLLYGLSDGSMGKRDAYYARSTMPMNRVFWADGIFDFTQSAIGPK